MLENKKRSMCIYCSSSNNLPEKFYIVSREIGEKLAKNGFNMV